MLHKRKFTYDRQSEKMLKNLKEIAEFEGYMDGAKEEFAALETKLTHNLDHELDRFSKEIKAVSYTHLDVYKRQQLGVNKLIPPISVPTQIFSLSVSRQLMKLQFNDLSGISLFWRI